MWKKQVQTTVDEKCFRVSYTYEKLVREICPPEHYPKIKAIEFLICDV